MKKLLLFLSMALGLFSCEDRSDWDLQQGNNDFFVVDGIITNEMRYQQITLSKPVAQLNDKQQPVSGAVVLVSSDQSVYSFHEDPEKAGTYISDTLFSGIRNHTYSLLINKDNRAYSAKAVLEPPVLLTEFIPLGYEKNENNDLYHLTNIPETYNPYQFAMYEVQLDWTSVPGYENDNDCLATLYFYTLPTIDVSELFAPAAEQINFPAGTIITQRRYSLTASHAAFLRALLLETTWTGGYFNTASANIPTNMSEGAAGFFGACGVMEKVEIVE